MITLKFQTKNKRLLQQVQGKWDKHTFRVGVMQDRPHKTAQFGRGSVRSFHGGPARKKTNRSNESVGLVSSKLRTFLGFDFYTVPFSNAHKKSQDILNLFKSIVNFGGDIKGGEASAIRRVENALQAVVRNPFLRGDYGRNTKKWAKIKGFNRLGIDTGQVFDNIKAKVD